MSLVPFSELAAQLGLDRSNALKWIKPACQRLDIPMTRARHESARGQPTYVWSVGDTEKLLAERTRQGFSVNGTKPHPIEVETRGVLYVVQVIPEARPERLKVGFTQDMERRLASHRCIAPTSELLASWPCEATDEPFLIRVAMRSPSAKRIGPEVMDADPDEVIERLNRAMRLIAPDGESAT